MVLILGYIAHGKNDIGQDHNIVAASAGNLEYRLIVNLFITMQSDIRDLRTEIRKQEANHEEKLEEVKIKHEAEMEELKAEFENAEHLEQLKSTFEEEILELKAKFENADIAKLTAEVEQLKKKWKDMPKTVFAQIQLRGEKRLTAGKRVKFTTTVANVGDAYKATEGYFEAPYDGTYLFTVSLCMDNGNWVEFRIVQDSNILAEGHPGDSDWHACGSATAATYMRKGSKVWVELDRVSGGRISDEAGITSFTGVFVNDFKKQ